MRHYALPIAVLVAGLLIAYGASFRLVASPMGDIVVTGNGLTGSLTRCKLSAQGWECRH